MKSAIITGATGAIGTALIHSLIEDNIKVLVLLRKGSKRIDNIPKSHLVSIMTCSLNELSSLQNVNNEEYDVFYHFAWDGTINPYRNDMHLQTNNIKYTLDAIECAKRFGCKKFVGAGSQAEYGRVEGILKPSTPCNPENGYGIAKYTAGLMAKEHSKQLGLEFNWVRVLSVYGPNDGSQSLVMSEINALLHNEIPSFTLGEQMWDYLYSGDAGNAFKLVGQKGIDTKTYVLGGGNARPLREYIEIIRDVINPNAKLGIGNIPYSPKQVMYLCADISELINDTGWYPKTSFEFGIKSIL